MLQHILNQQAFLLSASCFSTYAGYYVCEDEFLKAIDSTPRKYMDKT